MSEQDWMYLRVVSGPILAVCEDWRKRVLAIQRARFDFAKSFGAEGYCVGARGAMLGLVAPTGLPAPPGWQWKHRKGSERSILRPTPGAAGAEVRAQMCALPDEPWLSGIAYAIGVPDRYQFTRPGSDDVHKGWIAPHALDPVQLFWGHGPTLMIQCPDVAAQLAALRDEHPDWSITPRGWEIPAGLEIITKAEKDLILAQEAVDKERAMARAKAGLPALIDAAMPLPGEAGQSAIDQRGPLPLLLLTELPDYDLCAEAAEAGHATALQRFIADDEPDGPSDTAWRASLLRLFNEIQAEYLAALAERHPGIAAILQGEAVAVPKDLLGRFPELNMSNYGPDDVCILNDWGCEVAGYDDGIYPPPVAAEVGQ